MDLNEYRVKIDEIDRQMVALFAERMETAADIAAYKKEHRLPVLDAARERQKLRQIAEQAPAALQDETETLYRLLFELSRSYQNRLLGSASPLPAEIEKAISDTPQLFPPRAAIACQGVEGAYSQLACERLFRTPDIFYFSNFEAVFSAVDKGLCRYGVVPLENSTAGSVNAVYDLMMRYNFRIVRSVRLKVDHCLLALPPVQPFFAVAAERARRPLRQHRRGRKARGRIRPDGRGRVGIALLRGALRSERARGVGAGSGQQLHPLHLHLKAA